MQEAKTVCLLANAAIVFLLAASVSETVEMDQFKLRRDVKLNSTYVSSTIKVKHVLGCLSACKATQSCSSVSWHGVTGQCLMSDKDVMNGIDYNGVIAIGTWVTYVKKQWNVWHRASPISYYTMTYNQAAETCAQDHGRLALMAELLAERARGYDLCKCAWFFDGGNGFVVQYHNSNCWSTFTTGINFCTNAFEGADAWCFENYN